MLSSRFVRTLILAGVVLTASIPAMSATLYTNRALFMAATSNQTNIDFNGIASSGGYASYGAGPLTLSGVDFTGNGSMFVIDPGFYGSPYAGGGYLNSDYGPDGINVITAALPSGVYAAGVDFGNLFGGVTADFTFTLSNGDTVTLTSSNSVASEGPLDFVGLVSSSAITSMTMTSADAPGYNAYDNFVYAQATPEPTSSLLLGTGLVGLAGFRLRKRD